MDILLTVVVPTYNMEQYLDRCLRSLIVGSAESQAMCSLEVLVVNDGSTDRSSQIAHGYEEQYPNTFRVIDKENGNYGSCINAALPLVTGKYVKILDADDWFNTKQLSYYLTQISKINVDAIMNDFDMIGTKNKLFSYQLCSLCTIPSSALLSGNHDVWMHAVAYRTSLLREIKYHQTEGISYTDQEWIFLPMAAAKDLFYIPGVLYHYYQGRDDQTVNAKVFERNFWMETKGLDHMIHVLLQYATNQQPFTSPSINIQYLKERLLCRCGVVYHNILLKNSLSSYLGYLRDLDYLLKKQLPDIYQRLTTSIYPDKEYSQYKFRCKYVKIWRNHSWSYFKFRIWILQHYMGIIFRINKFRGVAI